MCQRSQIRIVPRDSPAVSTYSALHSVISTGIAYSYVCYATLTNVRLSVYLCARSLYDKDTCVRCAKDAEKLKMMLRAVITVAVRYRVTEISRKNLYVDAEREREREKEGFEIKARIRTDGRHIEGGKDYFSPFVGPRAFCSVEHVMLLYLAFLTLLHM